MKPGYQSDAVAYGTLEGPEGLYMYHETYYFDAISETDQYLSNPIAVAEGGRMNNSHFVFQPCICIEARFDC